MSSAASADSQSIQILRLPAVCRVTGLSRSMIYQLEAQREFPARVRIAARAVGWIEGEVQVWLAERVSQSRFALVSGPCAVYEPTAHRR